jgi:hypothetical protein
MVIGTKTAHPLSFATGGSSKMTILPSGNVGIGTTGPQGKLDVRGDIRAGNSDIYFTRTDHNHTGTGNAAGWAAIENAANYDALMILGRAGTARGRMVRLWDYLQVNGGMDVTGNVEFLSTSNPIRVSSGWTGFPDAVNNKAEISNDTGTYKTLMIVGNRSAGLGRRVSVWDRLEVNGSLEANGDISIRGKHALRGNDTWLRLNQDGAFGAGVHTPGVFAPGSLNVGGVGGWGNPGGGNVWVAGRVGTLGWPATPRTPGWGGGIRTWDVEAEGTMWSQHGYKQGSDARTKTNVSELSGVLDKLSAIRGVSFERIGTSAPATRSVGQRNIGVIAQEIEEAFPELVSEHGDEGYKAVDYSGLTGVLVEAAKELSAENEGLRSRIEILERG